MAVNKLALMRYKTLDDCLRNRRRKWTLEDLIGKVGEVLYEREGVKGISRRTIQADLQLMRSDKLGYNAPIVVSEKKYYSYADAEFSITNTPINTADLEKMHEIVGMLKQFSGFSYFEEMSEMIARLESNLHQRTNNAGSCIQFEDNQRLKGREHLMPLYQAILGKRAILLDYRSFQAKQARQGIYHPYLLKEYRNRWFLIAKPRKGTTLMTLALDRVEAFQELPNEPFIAWEGIDFDRYYSDLVGVTKSEKDRPRRVILHVSSRHAPYVITKPLHHSQQVLKEDESGAIIRIDVIVNFELEREILGFGECMKVLAPKQLQQSIARRLEKAVILYGAPAEE